MSHVGRIVPGRVESSHLVQLFDEPESRASGVAAFLAEAFAGRTPMLVVARPESWSAIARELETGGCCVTAAIAEGRLVVLDAQTTLARFVRNGRPDAARFEASVGVAVEQLALHGNLRIYGEMVDILAGERNFEAAYELELLWNELAARESFVLLCGYSSAHFGDPRDASQLQRICCAHSHAEAYPGDVLGPWLLTIAGAEQAQSG